MELLGPNKPTGVATAGVASLISSQRPPSWPQPLPPQPSPVCLYCSCCEHPWLEITPTTTNLKCQTFLTNHCHRSCSLVGHACRCGGALTSRLAQVCMRLHPRLAARETSSAGDGRTCCREPGSTGDRERPVRGCALSPPPPHCPPSLSSSPLPLLVPVAWAGCQKTCQQ